MTTTQSAWSSKANRAQKRDLKKCQVSWFRGRHIFRGGQTRHIPDWYAHRKVTQITQWVIETCDTPTQLLVEQRSRQFPSRLFPGKESLPEKIERRTRQLQGRLQKAIWRIKTNYFKQQCDPTDIIPCSGVMKKVHRAFQVPCPHFLKNMLFPQQTNGGQTMVDGYFQ